MAQPVVVEWRVEFGHLDVKPEMLGQTIELGIRDSVRVEAALPTETSQWGGEAAVTRWRGGQPVTVGIGRVLVRAYLSTELERLVAVPSYDQATAPDVEEAQRLFTQAAQATEVVLYRFVESVRRRTGNFLIDYDFSPLRQSGSLFVGERRNYIGFARPPIVFRSLKMGEDLDLTGGDGSTIAACSTAGEEEPLAWRALGRAWRTFELHGDVRQAIIEAAIAVEVGSKEGVLKTDPTSDLVKLLVARAHLHELRTTVAKAVLGQSYADFNPRNHKLILTLTEERQGIVHSGAQPTASRSATASWLKAVQDLLEWFDASTPCDGGGN